MRRVCLAFVLILVYASLGEASPTSGDTAENFEAADRPKSVDIADEMEPTDRKRRSADKELLPRLNINGALGGAANMLNATGLVDGLQDTLNLLGGLIGNNRGTPIKM